MSTPRDIGPRFTDLDPGLTDHWYRQLSGAKIDHSFSAPRGKCMEFVDRLLTCADCGGEFIFTAGEQLFFLDKNFKNDPKRCKPCKSKRSGAAMKTGIGP